MHHQEIQSILHYSLGDQIRGLNIKNVKVQLEDPKITQSDKKLLQSKGYVSIHFTDKKRHLQLTSKPHMVYRSNSIDKFSQYSCKKRLNFDQTTNQERLANNTRRIKDYNGSNNFKSGYLSTNYLSNYDSSRQLQPSHSARRKRNRPVGLITNLKKPLNPETNLNIIKLNVNLKPNQRQDQIDKIEITFNKQKFPQFQSIILSDINSSVNAVSNESGIVQKYPIQLNQTQINQPNRQITNNPMIEPGNLSNQQQANPLNRQQVNPFNPQQINEPQIQPGNEQNSPKFGTINQPNINSFVYRDPREIKNDAIPNEENIESGNQSIQQQINPSNVWPINECDSLLKGIQKCQTITNNINNQVTIIRQIINKNIVNKQNNNLIYAFNKMDPSYDSPKSKDIKLIEQATPSTTYNNQSGILYRSPKDRFG